MPEQMNQNVARGAATREHLIEVIARVKYAEDADLDNHTRDQRGSQARRDGQSK